LASCDLLRAAFQTFADSRKRADWHFELLTWTSIAATKNAQPNKEAVWQTTSIDTPAPFFERTSKRRKGFPSETQVKRGERIVGGFKELIEKLGRKDPCPCGSSRKFKNCRMHRGHF
jgi:uncharacterized protein YecA (UPF0149 family)